MISSPDWSGDETLDPKRTLLSELHQGTLADYVVVPNANLIEKPANLSFEDAACLPTSWLTAYRMLPGDLDKLYVRNATGKMVPFSSFATGRWSFGSPALNRFNGFPSINIWGEAAPGRSSGESMQAMVDAMAQMPRGIGYDWSGLSYQEKQSSSQAPLLYAFSIFVIFLCLAALYESWPIPIAILLVLPLGVIGGVIATSWRGLANDVYFQIGLLTTLGLATKNAILIVQFAKQALEKGMDLMAATIEGAKLRFRPILMTSLAFGFGVLPMAMTLDGVRRISVWRTGDDLSR